MGVGLKQRAPIECGIKFVIVEVVIAELAA